MADFTDSALLGHVMSFALLATLTGKGIITRDDASEMLDTVLLMLEQMQSGFPEQQASFESARDFLSKALSDLPTTTPTPPWQTP
jgi:hypothetical protein